MKLQLIMKNVPQTEGASHVCKAMFRIDEPSAQINALEKCDSKRGRMFYDSCLQ
jgi:hypothetical protein